MHESKHTSLRGVLLWLGPILAAAAGLASYHLFGWSSAASWTIGVTVICILWWIFEPVPIPVTSLFPLALLPLSGAMPISAVSSAYGSPLILLLLGGFILATALEHSGAHRRLAITMCGLFGSKSSKRLVMGFMATSALLSMWISNTATTLMLLPVALAVLGDNRDPKVAIPLLLGIAHAASVGGLGTPIGTPPNLIFMQVYADNGLPEISFARWMSWGIPVVVVMVPLLALWLTRNTHYKGGFKLPEAGAWTTAEKRVMAVFALTACAWIFRTAPFGGWSGLLGLSGAHDSQVAFLAVILMFVVPDGQGGRLLTWKTASTIPWGVLLLFAGGIAIAKAFVSSGISAELGEVLSGFASLNIIMVIMLIAICVTFMTEMTSNTATTTLLMPILAAAALGANLDPRLLMVPAALSASCAFMLPVATAPNAIVYSTGRFSVGTMVREGFVLNMIGVVVITAAVYLFFGLSAS